MLESVQLAAHSGGFLFSQVVESILWHASMVPLLFKRSAAVNNVWSIWKKKQFHFSDFLFTPCKFLNLHPSCCVNVKYNWIYQIFISKVIFWLDNFSFSVFSLLYYVNWFIVMVFFSKLWDLFSFSIVYHTEITVTTFKKVFFLLSIYCVYWEIGQKEHCLFAQIWLCMLK